MGEGGDEYWRGAAHAAAACAALAGAAYALTQRACAVSRENPATAPHAAPQQPILYPDTDAADTLRVASLPRVALEATVPNRRFGPDFHSAHYASTIGDEEYVRATPLVNVAEAAKDAQVAYVRAGPRPLIVHEPGTVVAAVATCGGLCPGLNNVVRALTLTLVNSYRAKRVLGIRFGLRGFYDSTVPPIELTSESVSGIHRRGGTILASSRGGADIDRIIAGIQAFGIHQVYLIGGDGTHRAAAKLSAELQRRNLPISVIGIPKTIDNDIGIIDRSFGFDSTVAEAVRAVRSAKVEASAAQSGVGIVKLMGRQSGFIAAHAACASRDADLCLIPEVPVVFDGKQGAIAHVARCIERQGHAVLVVAEGALGPDAVQRAADGSVVRDPSGNPRLADAGTVVRDKMVHGLREYHGIDPVVKYIDPTYMIRAVPANAADSFYCTILAENAVHAAMAGFTAVSSCLVANRTVYIPVELITARSPRSVNPDGRTWERVVSVTLQPRTFVE